MVVVMVSWMRSRGERPDSSFEVSNSQASITTVSLASAKNEFYVALPTLTANTYWFSATADGKNYVAKAVVSKATEAGKYYWTSSEDLARVFCMEVIYNKVNEGGISFEGSFSYSDHYVRVCLAF